MTSNLGWVVVAIMALLGALVSSLITAGCSIARHRTYPAPNVEVPEPPPTPIRQLWLPHKNERIAAWLLPAADADGRTPVILAFHGNGENLETMRLGGTLNRLSRLDAHVLAIDYPSYGRSTGSPDQETVIAAALSAYAYVAKTFPTSPRLVWGWSLGAAVAAQVASRHASELCGVALLSPWSNLAAVVRRMVPPFFVTLFLRDEFDTLKAAQRITAPTLIVHGARDDLIPVEQGRAVWRALPRPYGFLEVEQAGHNDLLSFEQVWEALDKLRRAQCSQEK
ncbi:MAG: lysophospholipase [Myxococcota bacterium]|nr:lysophospholipase [Myxococcota bacterium]